jgi:hypothetical protein
VERGRVHKKNQWLLKSNLSVKNWLFCCWYNK